MVGSRAVKKLSFLLLVVLLGCPNSEEDMDAGTDSGPQKDTGVDSGTSMDAGFADGGFMDSGVMDSGAEDAGFADTGTDGGVGMDAGGMDSGMMCPDGTWDDDGDPGTACIAWTDCVPGEYVSMDGTPVTDRECTTCPPGTDSTETNAPACLDPCEMLVGVTCASYAEAYVKADNPDQMDFFGISVDLDGDTMVVGANFESSDSNGVNGVQNEGAFRSGAAYVFTRTGTVWSQEAFLKASNTDDYDYFGEAVAISGNTIVVGAYGEDSIASGIDGDQTDNTRFNVGAAYVFVRNGTTWTQQAYLKPSNTSVGGFWFGRAVDIDADTIAVGAWHEPGGSSGVNGDQNDTSLSGSGAVYVFTRNGTIWSQQAYIKSSNPDLNDEFGYDVAIDGDTLIASAPSESSGADGIDGDQTDDTEFYAGAVYVFTRNGTIWSQEAYVKASNSDGFDYFGRSLDIQGDTMVVGAPGESSTAAGVGADQTINTTTWTGAVYVFTRTAGVWTQEEYIKAAVTGADRFGTSLAFENDTLLVGANFEGGDGVDLLGDPTNGGAFASGAAYLFSRTSTVWTQRAYIKASNTQASDSFGRAVALSGDTFVVGSDEEDSNATGINGDQTNDDTSDSGAVYVRRFSP